MPQIDFDFALDQPVYVYLGVGNIKYGIIQQFNALRYFIGNTLTDHVTYLVKIDNVGTISVEEEVVFSNYDDALDYAEAQLA